MTALSYEQILRNRMAATRQPGGSYMSQFGVPAAPVAQGGAVPAGGGIPGQQVAPQMPGQQMGPQMPPTGLYGSEQALQGGLQGGLAALLQGMDQGRGDLMSQFNSATRGLTPFIQPGQQAQGLQGAFSGAMGPEAQAQAFAQYRDSPGQAYLRERGERAVTRNASALGGLGGGRVMQELQRQGIGLAEQAYGEDFNRLGQVAGQGLQAAGMAGQLRGQAGQTLGNMGLQGGLQASNMFQQTGRDTAAGRTQAGRDIAGNISGVSSGLSNLSDQQGRGISDLLGLTGGNLAQLLAGAGQAQGDGQMDLATLLANLGIGASSQYAGLPSIPGTQQNDGQLGNIGRAAMGIGTMMTSDSRLKTNKQRVGVTPGGRVIYTWDWNEEGMRLAGGQPGFGGMADENLDISMVGPHGYLMMDYARFD